MERDRALGLLDNVREIIARPRKEAVRNDELRLWGEGILGAVGVRAGMFKSYTFEASGIRVHPGANYDREDEGIFSPERFIGYLASLTDKEFEEGKVLGDDEGVRAIMGLLDEESDYVEFP